MASKSKHRVFYLGGVDTDMFGHVILHVLEVELGSVGIGVVESSVEDVVVDGGGGRVGTWGGLVVHGIAVQGVDDFSGKRYAEGIDVVDRRGDFDRSFGGGSRYGVLLESKHVDVSEFVYRLLGQPYLGGSNLCGLRSGWELPKRANGGARTGGSAGDLFDLSDWGRREWGTRFGGSAKSERLDERLETIFKSVDDGCWVVVGVEIEEVILDLDFVFVDFGNGLGVRSLLATRDRFADGQGLVLFEKAGIDAPRYFDDASVEDGGIVEGFWFDRGSGGESSGG